MSSDGKWVVTIVRLSATGNGRDGEWLRVSHRGFFVGEARDWNGVARLGVDTGDLREEALGLQALRRRSGFGGHAAPQCSPGDLLGVLEVAAPARTDLDHDQPIRLGVPGARMTIGSRDQPDWTSRR
jgi:hypothetical protein